MIRGVNAVLPEYRASLVLGIGSLSLGCAAVHQRRCRDFVRFSKLHALPEAKAERLVYALRCGDDNPASIK